MSIKFFPTSKPAVCSTITIAVCSFMKVDLELSMKSFCCLKQGISTKSQHIDLLKINTHVYKSHITWTNYRAQVTSQWKAHIFCWSSHTQSRYSFEKKVSCSKLLYNPILPGATWIAKLFEHPTFTNNFPTLIAMNLDGFSNFYTLQRDEHIYAFNKDVDLVINKFANMKARDASFYISIAKDEEGILRHYKKIDFFFGNQLWVPKKVHFYVLWGLFFSINQ